MNIGTRSRWQEWLRVKLGVSYTKYRKLPREQKIDLWTQYRETLATPPPPPDATPSP